MIGKSWPEYVFIRLCIIFLRLVAPLSAFYLVVSAWLLRFPGSRYFGYAAVAETVFYLAVFLPRLHHLQLPPVGAHLPPPLSQSERRAIFEKCRRYGKDINQYPRGWFLEKASDIRRENVREWILWSLFSSTLSEARPEWEGEIDEYIAGIEQVLGTPLSPGRLSFARSIRLNFDPVIALHRPLLWYFIVMLVDALTCFRLYLLGFKHHSPTRFVSNTFPPRPLTLLSHHSPTRYLSYWHFRRTTSGTPTPPNQRCRPLVFIHGIGIGLHPYLPLFQELLARSSYVHNIILIELLPISFHITDTLPPQDVILDSIEQVLQDTDARDAVLAAHSYGTVIAAHIIRWQNRNQAQSPSPLSSFSSDSHETDPRTRKTLSSISNFMLIDPIPFMLHLPDIAKNFLYRTPRTANEWQLWYFASTDPDVARVLGRHFFWHQNILWKEDLFPAAPSSSTSTIGASTPNDNNGASTSSKQNEQEHRSFVVTLSGEDQIIPAPIILRYLREGLEEENRMVPVEGRKPKERLKVIFEPELDHAQIFERKRCRKGLLDALEELLSFEESMRS